MKISTPVSRILATGTLAAFLIVPSFAQVGAKKPATPATPPAKKAATATTSKTKMTTHKKTARHATHKAAPKAGGSKMAPAKKSG